MGKIDFDDLMGEKEYSGSRAYNQSKLANVTFTFELAWRDRGHRDQRYIPASRAPPSARRTRPWPSWSPSFVVHEGPRRGAKTPIFLAKSAEVEGVTGRYFANRKAKRSHESSYDGAAGARLWQVSADLVGVPLDTRR